MKIFDEPLATDSEPSVDFRSGDPLDVFAQLHVYVEYDSDQRTRKPVEVAVAGHPGLWICVYSSMARLVTACGDEVEYSVVTGSVVLAQLPDHAGLWFDRASPGGRKLLLPPVDVIVDAN
jgi:hypothetical protein